MNNLRSLFKHLKPTSSWWLCLTAMVLMLSLTSADTKRPITIFMIGDSTMANKPLNGNNQERGWGQMLSGFFTDDIRVDNHALNGRSSLSFILEGEWQKVYDAIQPGDYVFIQFGHNDEKIKSENRGTRPGSPEPALCPDQWGRPASFDDNLRKFVNETREKGGIPVLFNSIARRSFFENKNAAEEDDLFGKGITLKAEGDSLVETHIITRGDGTVDDYLEAPRRIAKEMKVPFVEMNAISKKVIQGEGVEGSKGLFCWLPANTYAAAPKGREDNTHLRISGARKMCAATIDAIGEAVPALKPFIRKYDLVVAKDGSGDFMTIQEAINAVPDYNGEEIKIMIAPGTYKEKLVVPESKSHVTLIARTEGEVIITNDDYAGKTSLVTGRKLGTSGSSTVYIYAPYFEAIGIIFENTASNESFAQGGRGVGQAVAVLVAGDCVVFRRCKFLGHQDTLYAYGRKSDPKTPEAVSAAQTQRIPENMQSRQYYEDCYIAGTVDYIFGWATAYFNRCELHCLGDGYVTAAATPQGQSYGYVFNECHITAEPGVQTYLGRPWRHYAQTVFVNCTMDECVRPQGWQTWPNKETGADGSATAFYAEYNSKGAGAQPKQRVAWSKQLNSNIADRFTASEVLKGYDNWNPVK
jgi:pectinesterase